MAADRHPTNPDPQSPQSLIGRQFGDFEIIEEIGRGGMGVVFRARQRSLERMVAFKILYSNLGLTGQSIERFKREALSTARLFHPHIVPIYAQGEQDGTYYYAMALVSGRSLADIIGELRIDRDDSIARNRRRPGGKSGGWVGGSSAADSSLGFAETEALDRSDSSTGSTTTSGGQQVPMGTPLTGSHAGRAIPVAFEHYDAHYFDEIARQIHDVADALDYAHRQNIVHRDIKPHNLLIGDQGRLCLTDFGLARMLEQPGVTMTGDIVGSPLYMSPEQITGDGAIGKATDIYSLGATLYEWLTLMPPFPGQTREQVITKIISSDPVSPRAINPRVPQDLETICLKALEKRPNHRYESASEMRDDLRSFLDREGIRARRAGMLKTIGKQFGRRRVLAIAAVAAVIILVLSMQLFRQRKQIREMADGSGGAAAQVDLVPTPPAVEAAPETSATIPSGLESPESSTGAASDSAAASMDRGARRAQQLKALLGLGEGAITSIVTAGDESAESEESRTPTLAERLGRLFAVPLIKQQRAQLLTLDPGSIEDESAQGLYVRGLLASVQVLEGGPIEPALRALDGSLAIEPKSANALLLRGWLSCLQCTTEELDCSIDTMLSVAEQLPDTGQAKYGRLAMNAVASLLNEDFSASLVAADAMKKIVREDVRTYIVRGLALMGLGQLDAAYNALSKALQLQPTLPIGLLKRAEISQAQQGWGAAIQDLTKLISIEPGNAEAYERRGDCYNEITNYDLAIADYLVSRDINPDTRLMGKITTAAMIRDSLIQQRERDQARAKAEEPKPSGKDMEPDTDKELTFEQVWKVLQESATGPKDGKPGIRAPQMNLPSTVPSILPWPLK